MNIELLDKVKELLIKHEGYRNFPYIDTVGKITIGVGYNLSDRGLPNNVIREQLMEDIKFFHNYLSAVYLWFHDLTQNRQIALLDMIFNLGTQKFHLFKKMIAALENKDYDTATREMLESQWAQQVGNRAQELAEMIKKG